MEKFDKTIEMGTGNKEEDPNFTDPRTADKWIELVLGRTNNPLVIGGLPFNPSETITFREFERAAREIASKDNTELIEILEFLSNQQ